MSETAPETPPIARRSTWLRLLYMSLFAVVFQVVELILALIAVVQFAALALSGEPFGELKKLGGQVSEYARSIASFLTFETDRLPFPFARERDASLRRSKIAAGPACDPAASA